MPKLGVPTGTVIELTSDIVSAFVSNNSVPASEMASIIRSVFEALILTEAPKLPAAEPPKEPAVPVKKSLTHEYLICLEDGRQFKSLKRHLRAKYGMSPEDYRAKWNLPKDYPMVAPAYSLSRSALAVSNGLGQGGRRPAKAVAKPRAAKK
jgi:predicted transcriptional regulator